jgi:hypothetical protein
MAERTDVKKWAIQEATAEGIIGTIESAAVTIAEDRSSIVMMGEDKAAILAEKETAGEGTAAGPITESAIAQEKETGKITVKEGMHALVIAVVTAGITAVMGEVTTGGTIGGMIESTEGTGGMIESTEGRRLLGTRKVVAISKTKHRMLMLKLSPLVITTSNQVSRGVARADGMNRKYRKTVCGIVYPDLQSPNSIVFATVSAGRC